jgi:hypothetical protein
VSELVPSRGQRRIHGLHAQVGLVRVPADEPLAGVGLDLDDGVLAGGEPLHRERLAADEDDLAQVPDPPEQDPELLHDDREPLGLGHGGSSGGGREAA